MSAGKRLALYLAGVCLFSGVACAGPLLPCITSAQSADGKVLVTSTLVFDDPDETHPRGIVSAVYKVYRPYSDLNEGLRLNGPNTYWADPFWKVEFPRPGAKSLAFGCSYVLVPNSGEYLVFVSAAPSEELVIYHRHPHDAAPGPLFSQQGELVRTLTQKDLWPSAPRDRITTDHTPMWFAGGVFAFSSDEKKLTYKDKNGKELEIDLPTGELKRFH